MCHSVKDLGGKNFNLTFCLNWIIKITLDGLLPKALHFNGKFKGTEVPLLVSPLGILMGPTFPDCPTTEWRKLWAVVGWRSNFGVKGCLYGTKASVSPPLGLHQSREQEELQFKCPNLGKRTSRILTTFSRLCCNKGDLKQPSGGAPSQSLTFFLRRTFQGWGRTIPSTGNRRLQLRHLAAWSQLVVA